jgi:hypothetical protein
MELLRERSRSAFVRHGGLSKFLLQPSFRDGDDCGVPASRLLSQLPAPIFSDGHDASPFLPLPRFFSGGRDDLL